MGKATAFTALVAASGLAVAAAWAALIETAVDVCDRAAEQLCGLKSPHPHHTEHPEIERQAAVASISLAGRSILAEDAGPLPRLMPSAFAPQPLAIDVEFVPAPCC